MPRSGPRGPQRNPRQWLPIATRFWARVDTSAGSDGCHLWLGARIRSGHGVLGTGGEHGPNVLAHRLAWELANGPVPEGLYVCHHCDHPPCVNPRHLFIGTQTDNMRDCAAKGRVRSQYVRKLADDDVRRIRASTLTATTLSEIFGVAQSTINRVRRRVAWEF